MRISRTINADKRYYLDEDTIINAGALVETIKQFNNMKVSLYNAMYDDKYLMAGNLASVPYSAWLKERFGTNDYYNCAVYTYASAVMASQKELKELHIETSRESMETRSLKIGQLEEKHGRKRKIKESLTGYAKTGKWKTPYKGCQVKVAGRMVKLPGGKAVPVDQYERDTEKSARQLKTRLALAREAQKRAGVKLAVLESSPPKRVLFGTREFYRVKDRSPGSMEAWKREFSERRHASMSLPGRHTSKDCNFLVRRPGFREMQDNKEKYFSPDLLVVKCMDGTEAMLKDFRLARYHGLWLEKMALGKKDRGPICYNFTIKRDRKGRQYIQASVTMALENKYCNESFENGCVSIDLNYDHVALSDIDRDGNLLGKKILRLHPENHSGGQVSDEIGRVMSMAGEYCQSRKKPLVMEDLDTTVSKAGMKYGAAKRNRRASLFAYRKMTACLENQSYKRSFGIIKTKPAYTSQIGKILYMRRTGLSIHSAASYVIGLKGMGLLEKLLPDKEMVSLLPEAQRGLISEKLEEGKLMRVWRLISKTFSEVHTHSFYRKIPYSCLEGRRRPPKNPLKAVASEMSSWTQYRYSF